MLTTDYFIRFSAFSALILLNNSTIDIIVPIAATAILIKNRRSHVLKLIFKSINSTNAISTAPKNIVKMPGLPIQLPPQMPYTVSYFTKANDSLQLYDIISL